MIIKGHRGLGANITGNEIGDNGEVITYYDDGTWSVYDQGIETFSDPYLAQSQPSVFTGIPPSLIEMGAVLGVLSMLF